MSEEHVIGKATPIPDNKKIARDCVADWMCQNPMAESRHNVKLALDAKDTRISELEDEVKRLKAEVPFSDVSTKVRAGIIEELRAENKRIEERFEEYEQMIADYQLDNQTLKDEVKDNDYVIDGYVEVIKKQEAQLKELMGENKRLKEANPKVLHYELIKSLQAQLKQVQEWHKKSKKYEAFYHLELNKYKDVMGKVREKLKVIGLSQEQWIKLNAYDALTLINALEKTEERSHDKAE